ncbi:MAG: prepilin-type N-terminal cleavage/methylation domain-containing protein [Patescibacteria group bacterium]
MAINKKKYSHQKGFTLLELLVVIAIIGLLSSIAVVALQNVRAEARDTKRLADVRQILLALEIYHEQFGEYPVHGFQFNCGVPGHGFSPGGYNYIPGLVTENIMPTLPVDPLYNDAIPHEYCYSYFLYHDPGAYNCDTSRGRFFVLYIKDLETWDGPGQHPSSPGWTCGDYDWVAPYDWATGGWEN